MTNQEFLLKIINIKDVSLATISLDGKPKNRIIDMMYLENDCLYFLTAKGKSFYFELMNNNDVALSSINQKIAYTLTGKAVLVDEKVYLPKLFENNKFMEELYPESARAALVVFKIDEWMGEYFDLNKRPIERMAFSNIKTKPSGYFMKKENCINCKKCLAVCPSQCIDLLNKQINQNNCLHCGNCLKVCPFNAIEYLKD